MKIIWLFYIKDNLSNLMYTDFIILISIFIPIFLVVENILKRFRIETVKNIHKRLLRTISIGTYCYLYDLR